VETVALQAIYGRSISFEHADAETGCDKPVSEA